MKTLLEYDPEFIRDLPALPIRSPDSHKGSYGTAALIGGSRGMSGAIALAGLGAIVAGAGLVRLLVPDTILETVAAYAMEYTTIPLPDNGLGKCSYQAVSVIQRELLRTTAVALGPGMGRESEQDRLVADLFFNEKNPMVVDADALNALAGEEGFATEIAHHEHRMGIPCLGGARIFTPHPKELSRLMQKEIPADHEGRKQVAREFCEKFRKMLHRFPQDHSFILVLKGTQTIITAGDTIYVNKTGNAGLATGGSGDVLTGIITGLLAMGRSPLDAARLGVALHGLAADCAVADKEPESMRASDIIHYYSDALRLLRNRKANG